MNELSRLFCNFALFKNGDVYENTFCSSNGKEYYVGDDGMLVRSSWVEYDGDYYFVNSSGAKIVNDWRLTTPVSYTHLTLPTILRV